MTVYQNKFQIIVWLGRFTLPLIIPYYKKKPHSWNVLFYLNNGRAPGNAFELN